MTKAHSHEMSFEARDTKDLNRVSILIKDLTRSYGFSNLARIVFKCEKYSSQFALPFKLFFKQYFRDKYSKDVLRSSPLSKKEDDEQRERTPDNPSSSKNLSARQQEWEARRLRLAMRVERHMEELLNFLEAKQIAQIQASKIILHKAQNPLKLQDLNQVKKSQKMQNESKLVQKKDVGANNYGFEIKTPTKAWYPSLPKKEPSLKEVNEYYGLSEEKTKPKNKIYKRYQAKDGSLKSLNLGPEAPSSSAPSIQKKEGKEQELKIEMTDEQHMNHTGRANESQGYIDTKKRSLIKKKKTSNSLDNENRDNGLNEKSPQSYLKDYRKKNLNDSSHRSLISQKDTNITINEFEGREENQTDKTPKTSYRSIRIQKSLGDHNQTKFNENDSYGCYGFDNHLKEQKLSELPNSEDTELRKENIQERRRGLRQIDRFETETEESETEYQRQQRIKYEAVKRRFLLNQDKNTKKSEEDLILGPKYTLPSILDKDFSSNQESDNEKSYPNKRRMYLHFRNNEKYNETLDDDIDFYHHLIIKRSTVVKKKQQEQRSISKEENIVVNNDLMEVSRKIRHQLESTKQETKSFSVAQLPKNALESLSSESYHIQDSFVKSPIISTGQLSLNTPRNISKSSVFLQKYNDTTPSNTDLILSKDSGIPNQTILKKKPISFSEQIQPFLEINSLQLPNDSKLINMTPISTEKIDYPRGGTYESLNKSKYGKIIGNLREIQGARSGLTPREKKA